MSNLGTGYGMAPWASCEELAWADAHGLDLSAWVRAEHAAGIRVAAGLANAAHARLLRRLDKQLAARDDELGELYRRGVTAQTDLEAERKRHRLSIARWPNWHPVCSCGWEGRLSTTRKSAERDLSLERDYLFRALAPKVEHYAERTLQVTA